MEPLMGSRQGFRRVYFDLPGMGQTFSYDDVQNSQDMLEFVCDFVDQVIPSGSFAIAGESYGGYLARGVAHHYRQRCAGMLLICPVIQFDRSKRIVPDLKVLEKDDELLSELSMIDAEDFQSCVVVQTRYVWERFNVEILSGVRQADFGLLERIRDTEFSFDPDEHASLFDKPTAFLLARYDNSVGYLDGMDLFKKYPTASLVVGDYAGHNLQIEQEDLFNAATNAWLDQLESNMT
jgi:pimeloyl-ACP methyl ester carboxylesterase